MLNLLIVDDSAYNRKLIRKIISTEDYDTLEAPDGQAALEVLSAEKIDCIILDLMMPELSGLEVLQILHDSRVTIPVIVVTADIQKETAQQCLGLGARYVLNKPVDKSALRTAIQDVLENAL